MQQVDEVELDGVKVPPMQCQVNKRMSTEAMEKKNKFSSFQ